MNYGPWMNEMLRPMMALTVLNAQGEVANSEYAKDPNAPLKMTAINGGLAWNE